MSDKFKSRTTRRMVAWSARQLPGPVGDETQDPSGGFYDSRNSFVPVWVSLPPFLLMEYFVELSVPAVPPALVFPVGFLLFWAFYFTYYRPNVLEDRLSDPIARSLSFPPSLILGFAIWFVRASFLELRYLVWESHFRKAGPVRASLENEFSKTAPRPEITRNFSAYPLDVQRALRVLGIEPGARVGWTEIHRRYRFLAKKFHPDLNDTGTQGRRFIEVDQAYRRLAHCKNLFPG